VHNRGEFDLIVPIFHSSTIIKKEIIEIIMTTSMIITLAVVVLMVIVIISDKLPFGAPALLAAALLVVLNQTDVATAFSGFTDKNVIMIMGFMACTAALQKTYAMYKLQGTLSKVASRGGIVGFVLLILTIMAIGNFLSGTAYYVLVISIVATIPYNKSLPTSRIVLPAAFATGAAGWLPNGAVMSIGIISSICATAGFENANVSVGKFILIKIIWSVIYLAYSTIMHRFLPDRDISDTAAEAAENAQQKDFVATLKPWQEKVVYAGYIFVIAAMFFLSKLPGESGYALPLIVAGIFLACGIYGFGDMIKNMFSPVIIMMAGVIGVAQAMSDSGLSGYLGDKIAGILGSNPSLLTIVLVFGFMTSIMASFTGASFGSLFIFAPIGAALCIKYGYSPVPLVFACTRAAWINYIVPIDGLPALAMGTGKYKLTEFWMYTLPMWIIQMTLICVLGTVFFA
jgi:di/tricarboxylate transporter